MKTVYGPGSYAIKLNGSGKPSLYTDGGTTPLDDPTFHTIGNARLVFAILDTSEIPDALIFSDPPMTWGDKENPLGNSHAVEGKTTLTLNVRPPAGAPLTATYHFKLHLDLGGLRHDLWSHDGKRRVDPTIIEKPPEESKETSKKKRKAAHGAH
jgi:hypothetical protein